LHLVGAIAPSLQSIQVANITTIREHPIPHVVVAMAVAVMRADKKVVEVIMITIAIVTTIEIRRSTIILLVISVTVFLPMTPVVTSIVVLMTARPMRT
jgi:hypothetical protein